MKLTTLKLITLNPIFLISIGIWLVYVILMPFIFIWVINSLAIAGGISFHLDYTLMNWFLSVLFLVFIRGVKLSKNNE